MSENKAKPEICFIVSSEITIKTFLLSHINTLNNSWNISIIVNAVADRFPELTEMGIRIIHVHIVRDLSPVKDLAALIKLVRIFSNNNFQIIHSVTPKAGLLAMIAGNMARIPYRIHIFTGQVWVTSSGLKRQLFKLADKIIAFSATHVLADSFSQKDFLLEQGIVKQNKINVLARGSICGVDINRFKPDMNSRTAIRKELGLLERTVVFLFMGRLKKDKGVLDLAEAFSRIIGDCPDAHLLFVGPDEEELAGEISQSVSDKTRVHFVTYTEIPEKFMVASDVLCLPSYREGFGSVIIEAAACAIPSIGSRIYGITDAIQENVTGKLHSAGNVDEIAGLLREFYGSEKTRLEMGEQARMRAERDFSKEHVTSALINFYEQIQQA